MYSMFLALHASASVGLIGREASAMSISPAQNRWKPPPVPAMPMVMRAFGFGALELLPDRFADRIDGAGAVERHGAFEGGPCAGARRDERPHDERGDRFSH
jgi:hypothetical protein